MKTHPQDGTHGDGRRATGDDIDEDLVHAGKKPVTLLPGGSFFDHATSFKMMRGGHLDFAILVGFQVSEKDDLASWSTLAIPAVGGAIDLAVGAKQAFVIMEMMTKQGDSKLVRDCTYPLTGVACVMRVHTNLAVLDVTSEEFSIRQMAPE